MEYTFKVITEECEEGGFFAECPAFQGCHVEGDTYEETMYEIKKLISGFIAESLKNGEPIPTDNYFVASVKVAV